MSDRLCVRCRKRVLHAFSECGASERLRPYDHRSGDEDAARDAWASIVDVGCDLPGFSIVLGAALGSVLVEPLGADTFVVHLCGGEGNGKTQLLRSAMSVVGDPDALVEPWRQGTDSDVLDRLQTAAVLPVAYDDADTLPTDLLGQMTEPGPPDASAPWRLVVFTAGRTACPGPLSLGARVARLAAPGREFPEQAQHVHDLSTAHHGWPLEWLAHSNVLTDAPAWFGVAHQTFTDAAGTLLGRALARQLAVAAVGFGALGRLVGRSLAFYAAVAAGERVLRDGMNEPTDAAMLQHEGTYLYTHSRPR